MTGDDLIISHLRTNRNISIDYSDHITVVVVVVVVVDIRNRDSWLSSAGVDVCCVVVMLLLMVLVSLWVFQEKWNDEVWSKWSFFSSDNKIM